MTKNRADRELEILRDQIAALERLLADREHSINHLKAENDELTRTVDALINGLNRIEQREFEKKLQQRIREQEALLEVNHQLVGHLDLEALLQVIVHALVDALPAVESASLWLYDELRQSIRMAAWAGKFESEVEYWELSDKTSAAGFVCRTGQPRLIRDTSTDEHFQPIGSPLLDSVKSILGVPLVIEGYSIGALFVDSYTRTNAFDENDARVLQSMAGQAALAIQRARLHQEAQKYANELELRVAERTNELSMANVQLQQEIEERRQAQSAEHELRTLAEALVNTNAALTSTLEFNEVLDQILGNLGKVVPHDGATLMLLDGPTVRIVRRRSTAEVAAIVSFDMFPLAESPALTEIVKTRAPLVISHVQSVPVTFTKAAEGLGSYAGAPICIGDEVIGILNIVTSAPDALTQTHAERLKAFADQAAIAIANAQTYAQAQELAVLKERQRLARDLHDAVSQTLWSASLIAEVLPQLWEQSPDRGREALGRLERLTKGAAAEMRTLLHELRPDSLLQAPLGEVLSQLCEAASSRTRAKILLHVEDDCKLPEDAQVTLYRIAQEALNNVIRHSAASQIEMSLTRDAEAVTLRIIDNGRGFDPSLVKHGHLGLKIMQERAASIHADWNLVTAPNQGTSLTVQWSERLAEV